LIEKMKFLSVTGPKNAFDHFVNVYLTKYEIQLENALSELSTVQNLRPFIERNPYRDLLGKSEEIISSLDKKPLDSNELISPDKASEIINTTYNKIENLKEKRKELLNQKDHFNDQLHQIEPFRHLELNLQKLMHFKFIKFRFGKVSHEHCNKFTKYIYENSNTFFYECERDNNYIWGIYFVPSIDSNPVDAMYSSLHFERIFIPDAYDGTPEEAYRTILARRLTVNNELSKINDQIKEILSQNSEELFSANKALYRFTNNFDVRKMAAITKENKAAFFILCGWISEKDANNIVRDIEDEPELFCMIDDGEENAITKPPTKLKNFKLFKPFEMFVGMYGFPDYNEIDPTSFVAITYSLIFGIMFGDVGQGLCLVIGGFLLYKLKHMNIAAIISLAGIFSTIFGFMYGSVFGFEGLVEPLWLSPGKNVMTVLLTAVGFGVVLILIAMILNIINGIKSKEYGKVFFDTNGIPGLIFYGMAITCVLLTSIGKTLPATIILVIFFVLPLLLIFFKEPLTNWLEKKSHIFPKSKVMFFVETIFELFEILLSYLTNTISFLRIGAFALSHAAMMGVVMLLAGAEGGHPNLIVIILGNIFVSAMEGLIVGIQVLRLEYYEMFSRFYKGTGKKFKPYKNK
jgi:V/A-type H+-transporting ATPase subunit I